MSITERSVDVFNTDNLYVSTISSSMISTSFSGKVGHEDLNLLGSIKPGETICVHSLSIVKHRSWTTWFWRSIHDENRLKTVAWVKTVVEFAMHNMCEIENKEFMNKIWKMRDGINNLSETYADDPHCQKYLKGLSDIATSMLFDSDSIILKYKDKQQHRSSTKPIDVQKEISEFILVDSSRCISLPEVSSNYTLKNPKHWYASGVNTMCMPFSVTPYNYFYDSSLSSSNSLEE